MTRDEHQHHDADAARAPPSKFAGVLDAWSQLDETSQTKFFAALLHIAMAKPTTQPELALWLGVMDDWEREMTAGATADLACMEDDGCDQQ